MRIVGVLLQAFLLLPYVVGHDKAYYFEQVSSEVGFTFSALDNIVEDEQGLIWFGGQDGVYFYNTVQIFKFDHDPNNTNTIPSNLITDLYVDRENRLWVCTDNGLCYFDRSANSFIRLELKQRSEYLSSEHVSSILQFQDKEYLIVLNNSLYSFNLDTLRVEKITLGDDVSHVSYIGKSNNNQFFAGTESGRVYLTTSSIDDFRLVYTSESGSVSSLCLINNQIWVGYAENGVDVITQEGELKKRYREEFMDNNHLPSNWVRKIIRRNNEEIWIGTYNGIKVLKENESQIIRHDPYNGLPHNSIYELYNGKNGGVWIGTWSGGLSYYNDYNYRFPHVEIIKENIPISNSIISAFLEEKDRNILVGSETSGISKFNPKRMTIENNEVNVSRLGINRIKSMATDKNGGQWIGTFMHGLWYLDDNKIERMGGQFDSCNIISLLPVDTGIWVGARGTTNALRFLNTEKGNIEYYGASLNRMGTISSNNIWDIFIDSKDNLWICSDFGLTVKHKNATDFKRFYANENVNSLSRNFNYTITEDNQGNLWIGSKGAGIDIFDPLTQTFRKFRLNSAIENADVYCFVNDKNGNIWFSTNQGVFLYNAQNNSLDKFNEQDDLLGTRYLPNSGFINSSGKVFFGGANGFNFIDPDAVQRNPIEPEVYLSKFLIDNQSFNEQKIKFINSKFPADIERIELKHYQNSLHFEFVANNFIKSENNRFRYMLTNYFDDWIESEHGNYISFTKIPPGNYVLKVLASNNDGVWNTKPKEIQIKIYPPVWASWYAYLLYFIILTTSFVIFLVARRRILKERYKHAADELIFSEKVKFFTNISHEFRTPLSLILSPVDHLLSKFMNNPELMNHLSVIKRNSDRLLRLTNQILDFRLIELNKLQLKQKETDIVNLSKNIYDCFEYSITLKKINCIFKSSFTSFYLNIDQEKIDNAIYNILSNALKHSHEKGQIIVSIEQNTLQENSYDEKFFVGKKFYGESIEINIKDNGKGISSDILPHIFNRFFKSSENEKPGTGIGLHICQEYVQLHEGNIMVSSEVGIGSTFTINLPIKRDAEFKKEPMVIQYHFDQLNPHDEEISLHTIANGKERIVVYAEDNDEYRLYFKRILSSRFRVLTAKNGQQAYEIAQEIIPDLIISDIMMPGIGGMELVGKIRSTDKTRHVPIILLTALSDETTKVEGISRGANDFITKPIKEEYLFAKIDAIFKNIETLKERYEVTGKYMDTSGGKESFIEKAERIVLDNLQNPSFGIGNFAAMLNISRSSFHRKLKSKINLSPSEFVRDIRLKKAVELIREGNLNMDEIGYTVGFNSQSYFIRSFKSKYGKTPSAFKAELREKKGTTS